MKEKTRFHEVSAKTQKEIAELSVKGDYKTDEAQNISEPLKEIPDAFLQTKTKFEDVSDKTQKEIAELFNADNYIPRDKQGKFTDTFDLFRIFNIENFVQDQLARDRARLNGTEEEQKAESERQFTDKESLKFAFGDRKAANIEVKVLKMESAKVEEINLNDKKILDKMNKNEQAYMKADLANQQKILKAVADLSGGYQVDFYH